MRLALDVSASPKRKSIKDPFSAISHYVGAVAGLTFGGFLVALASPSPIAVVAALVFIGSLVVLYVASGVYHTFATSSDRLQMLDHAAIYLLIAGTYTPICLLALPPAWGYSILAAQVALAIVGFVSVFRFGSKPRWLRIALCIVMGWMAIVAIGPLATHAPSAMVWLFGGGVVYSIGTVIYGTRRPQLWPGIFDSHDLWHVFVIGGTVCHAVAIWIVTQNWVSS